MKYKQEGFDSDSKGGISLLNQLLNALRVRAPATTPDVSPMTVATFLTCLKHRHKHHPYTAPQELARYALCLQNGPTVPVMGAFHEEKGNLIGTVEACKGHPMFTCPLSGWEDELRAGGAAVLHCQLMGVDYRWGSGLGREVIISKAQKVPPFPPPLGRPVSQGPRHRELCLDPAPGLKERKQFPKRFIHL